MNRMNMTLPDSVLAFKPVDTAFLWRRADNKPMGPSRFGDDQVANSTEKRKPQPKLDKGSASSCSN